mgnify:CR=1 FL=1
MTHRDTIAEMLVRPALDAAVAKARRVLEGTR